MADRAGAAAHGPRSAEPEPDGRISIGNASLDEILSGGLVAHRPYLIVGPCGTGKTKLALQFLCDGVRRGEKVLLVTLEDPPNEMRINHRAMQPDLDQIQVFDAIPDVMRYERAPFKDIAAVRSSVSFEKVPPEIRKTAELVSVEVTFSALEQTLKMEMMRQNYSRLVVDSLTALQYFCMKGIDETQGAQSFLRFLSDMRVTALLTVEAPVEEIESAERLLARGEIRLFRWELEGRTVRAIGVEKFRGSAHDTRLHPYRISPTGLDIDLNTTISRDTRRVIERADAAASSPPSGDLTARPAEMSQILADLRDLAAVGIDVAPVDAEVSAARAAAQAGKLDEVGLHLIRARAIVSELAQNWNPRTAPSIEVALTLAADRVARIAAAAGDLRASGIPSRSLESWTPDSPAHLEGPERDAAPARSSDPTTPLPPTLPVPQTVPSLATQDLPPPASTLSQPGTAPALPIDESVDPASAPPPTVAIPAGDQTGESVPPSASPTPRAPGVAAADALLASGPPPGPASPWSMPHPRLPPIVPPLPGRTVDVPEPVPPAVRPEPSAPPTTSPARAAPGLSPTRGGARPPLPEVSRPSRKPPRGKSEARSVPPSSIPSEPLSTTSPRVDPTSGRPPARSVTTEPVEGPSVGARGVALIPPPTPPIVQAGGPVRVPAPADLLPTSDPIPVPREVVPGTRPKRRVGPRKSGRAPATEEVTPKPRRRTAGRRRASPVTGASAGTPPPDVPAPSQAGPAPPPEPRTPAPPPGTRRHTAPPSIAAADPPPPEAEGEP
ncbi:MAG: hypothetical protein L3J95_00540 [Thermoplasmata archaeon]|nr:hypothetical protein [Thermoplasmata archaeon]MCI4358907.1 hypothetical protein [Thermoplasmata archaeon]